MSNLDQTCEQYWADTRMTQGYRTCIWICQPGSGRGQMSGGAAFRTRKSSRPETSQDEEITAQISLALGTRKTRKELRHAYRKIHEVKASNANSGADDGGTNM